jgi:mevalonate kinase
LTVKTSACGKIILFGEHAVVYGQPAIAVPITSLRAWATVSSNHEHSLRIIAEDTHETIEVHSMGHLADLDHPLAKATSLYLDTLKVPLPHLIVHLRSDIPIASGLGSGAAITTAYLRSLATGTNSTLELPVLNQLVYEIDKLHHATPSGVDNTVIVFEHSLLFRRGSGFEPISVKEPLHFIVADTGIASSTHVVVNDVRNLFNASRDKVSMIFEAMGEITAAANQAIKNGDVEIVGRLMVDNHLLLQKLHVSSPNLDTLVEIAMKNGAYGAKLSGAGRGGNMIALVSPAASLAVQNALIAAGAKTAFATTLS